MTPDKFYGFQETAEFCEHVITSLFSVNTPPSAIGVGQDGLQTPPQSPTQGKEAPPPLGEFIAYALYRTRLPLAITHQALLLLSRLKARYPSARGTSTSPHRLFLSSLMLSSKISMDDTYSNKSWQVVGQFFDLKEVNQMERELFAFLGWNVVVRDEELTAWVHDVYDAYQAERGQVAAAVAPRKSMEDRKRRRDYTTTSPVASTSTSRSPSPDELRHRRASDAAVALLHGPTDIFSSSASRRPRGRHSPYSAPTSASSSRPSSVCSSSSSTLSSPISGSTTPGSPSTPISAGPLTPDHRDHLAPPCWAKMGLSAKEDNESYDGPEPVLVASW